MSETTDLKKLKQDARPKPMNESDTAMLDQAKNRIDSETMPMFKQEFPHVLLKMNEIEYTAW